MEQQDMDDDTTDAEARLSSSSSSSLLSFRKNYHRRRNYGPFLITVEGAAGFPGVNGVYHQDGFFGERGGDVDPCVYTKEAGNDDYGDDGSTKLCIFLCDLGTAGSGSWWHITIVPSESHPGEDEDSETDLYKAPATLHYTHIPPMTGWVNVQEEWCKEPLMRLVHGTSTSSMPSEQQNHATHHHHHHHGPSQIVVKGAGTPEVNGVYHQDGCHLNAFVYSKNSMWNECKCHFYILKGNMYFNDEIGENDDNEKVWYISMVPYGLRPGERSDVDFYTVPVTSDCHRLPPSDGWAITDEGSVPAPTLEFCTDSKGDDGDDARNDAPFSSGKTKVESFESLKEENNKLRATVASTAAKECQEKQELRDQIQALQAQLAQSVAPR